MSVFFPRRWGNGAAPVTPGGFRSIFKRQIGGLGSPAFIPPLPPPTIPLITGWMWESRNWERRRKHRKKTTDEVIHDVIAEQIAELNRERRRQRARVRHLQQLEDDEAAVLFLLSAL